MDGIKTLIIDSNNIIKQNYTYAVKSTIPSKIIEISTKFIPHLLKSCMSI